MSARSRTLRAALGVALAGAVVAGGAGRPLGAQARGAGAPRPGAAETFVHESWTVKDGLPVNAITQLLQSRDGYIWIATYDGLVRFDGVRFTVFNSANSEGLPTNRIGQLLEAPDGALWLLTEQFQLVRFRDGTFTHFGPERGLGERVFAFRPDSSGALWVGTERGVGRIVGDRFVPVPGAWGVGGTVRTIVPRADGTTWAGTADGWLFRIAGGQATALAAGNELAGERVLLLHEDAERTLWIGTNAGLWRWHGAPADRGRGQAERVLRTEEQLGLGFRTSPRTGELWVETPFRAYRVTGGRPVPMVEFPDAIFGGGVLLPDDEGRMLLAAGPDLYRDGTRIYTLDADATSASGGATWVGAALLDHEGSLWLGTRAAGLHRLKPAPFRVYGPADGLPDRNVYSVYEDPGGAVWVGSFDGHVTRIGATGVTRYRGARAGSFWVKSLLQDGAGRLWVGSARGVQRCALPAMRCERPTPDPIGDAAVQAIHADAAGALWFGTDAGLHRLDGAGWRRWSEAEGAPTAVVRVFQQTRDGALWMGTAGGGLARYHGGRFRHVTTAEGLPFDHVRSLHEDADGWLWVGTEGRGLARLDPREWGGDARRRGRIVAVRARDGLFDEVIHQILPDDFGRLWMSTNRGIFWVDRRALLAFADGRAARIHSTGYTERDGLRNREANGGSQPAGARTRDGRLWFPTQDGVAVVDPARIRQSRVPPPVVVEQVVAGGRARRAGAGAITLGTAERDLQIDYTALSFLAPANVRFRYRLAPYDTGWVDAGSRRAAFYTRVPPGRYTFRVVAGNSDGVWNEAGAAVTLVLAPRVWERATFRLLALLAAAGLTAAGVQWRLRSLRARTVQLGRLVDERTRELREHEVQLESRNAQLSELHEARSRLFANLSHEFRTPLTLIMGPLRGLTDGRHGALPAGARAQLELALRNAQRALRLINQVLDLTRLQAGAVTLDRATHDLVAFARATTLAFAALAERRGVALRFDADVPELPGAVDAEQLEKVLLNLLSNALKFTEPGGAVEVRVGVAADAADVATIVVRDTGVGIAAHQLPRVFERFYQADASATRRYEGTGIGLALAWELVELHGGAIAAESAPGVGSTFTVRLPLGAAAFAPGAARRPAPPTPQRSAALEALTPARAPQQADEALATAASREDRTSVLVVDDNPDLRAYVRSILAPTYRVIEAADGRAGLEAARASLPDLIVADVMMPELDGLALGRALKGDAMTDAIPVVLLTARASPEDHVAGLATGADAYLVKPFEPAVLEACVAGLLAQRRRLRERYREDAAAETTPVADAPSAAASVAPPVAPSALDLRLRPLVVARLTDPALSPETLAAAAGLSYHQLYRALRDELGVSPSRFIRGVRVECAAERLHQGAGSVTEVAYSVGFESLSYFSRAFHERFDAAPSTFLGALGRK